MPLICRLAAIGLLLFGCAVQAKPRGIASSITYVNYQSGADIQVMGGYTDRGHELVSPGTLKQSSDLFRGPTAGSTDPEPGLPEWVELKWKELDPARRIPSDIWVTLDEAAREAHMKERAALPVKSARVPVRSLVPDHVIEELQQSPLDPTRANLRLKSIRLYFIWTRDGVKVRWKVRQGCCTVIHEGGEVVR